jgi:hypothetical protein
MHGKYFHESTATYVQVGPRLSVAIYRETIFSFHAMMDAGNIWDT